jgi:hypothetical protein
MTLMVFSFKKQIAAVAVSALALAPVATGVMLLSAEAAFAKPGGSGGGGGGGRDRSRSDRGDRDNGNRGGGRSNDNNRSGNSSSPRTTQTQTQTATTQQAPAQSNGNAYGQRTADEERPGQGAIRSELKGMNAIHSFKDGAFPDAAPGSQVGRLAKYYETAGVTSVALEDYDAALAAVTAFEGKNSDFIEDLRAQQELSEALEAFDDNYSAEGASLGIDSIEGAYSFINEAYGNDIDYPIENPIDTLEEIQAVIDSLDAGDLSNAEQIASLETLKTELETLEGLDAAIDPLIDPLGSLQVEYAALNVTLTAEQSDYQSAYCGEEAAFSDASNGRDISEFSEATIDYLRKTLGLGDVDTDVDCSST